MTPTNPPDDEVTDVDVGEVQRYELVSHGQYSMRYESLDKDPDGDWVKHDDHARIVAELRGQVERVVMGPRRLHGGRNVPMSTKGNA